MMIKVARWSVLVLVASSLAACGRSPTPDVKPRADVAPVATLAPAPVQALATPVASAQLVVPAAPAAPVAATAPKPPKRGAGDLKVRRLVIAEAVKGREPVDAGTSFRVGDVDRIYAFVEIDNGAGEPSQVTVEFEPPGGGAPSGNVTLDVGESARWRTWAYTRAARKPGEWTAVVRAPSGEVLAKAPFEVTL